MHRAVHRIHRLVLRQRLIGFRDRLRRKRRVHDNAFRHADRILDVFNAAQPATHAAFEAALHHAVAVQMLFVNREINRQPFFRRQRENALDMGRRRDDPFSQRKAHGEIIEIGRRRHHHRIGRGVEQDRDGNFFGNLPDGSNWSA